MFWAENPGKALAASLILWALATFEVACGGGSGQSFPQNPPPAGHPTFSHVVLIVEENHSYSDVVGSSDMPYLNSLISQYGLAAQFYANAHPSMPNYLMLTTGQIESFDDNFSGTISDDNVVRELVKAGKSWKAYEESIPAPGYLGGDQGSYVRRHDPFSYLSDIQKDSTQAANIVPFSEFAADLANGSLPQYAFIEPNVNNDAHNGTLAAADSWLQNNVSALLSNPSFQANGLLIITFDESEKFDIQNGGGHVATVIISSQAKKGFKSQTMYQHQSLLRLILASSGVDSFPGLAGEAPDMTEFFTGH